MDEKNIQLRGQLLKFLNEKRQQKVELEKQKVELDSDIKGLERTLLLFPNGVKPLDSRHPSFDAEELQGKTIMQILKILARRQGSLHYANVADFMLSNNFSSAKRQNLATRIYSMMSNSEEWAKTGRGTFALVESIEPKIDA